MIKSLALTNFFSFRSEKIKLNKGANILIGINGSGKSNFLKALTLLKTGTEGNQDDTALQDLLVSRHGGFDSVFCKSNDKTSFQDEIRLEFVFDKEVISSYGAMTFEHDIVYSIMLKRQSDLGNYFTGERITSGELTYLSFYNGKGEVTEIDKGQVNTIKYDNYSSQELALAKISEFDKDRYLPLVQLKRALRDITIYNQFDTTVNSKLRKSMLATSSTKQLLSDGTNLPQIINHIKINDKKAYQAILEKLRDVNPNFKTFDFNILGGSGVFELMLEEDNLKTSIHISHISDGTLRYLCLMAILYNPNKGKLICIDEPEVGLHPDMIYNVSRAIKEAAKEFSVIISTHSAELLNYFDLEDILVFEKNENNSTDVLSFTDEEFEGWYDEFLPGQMWKAGDLGGKRWQ